MSSITADTRFRRFRIILIGQLLSRVGSGLSAFALGVHVYQNSGSATAYSMLLLSAFLPSVLLNPIGGVLADRYDRKLLMIISDTGAACSIVFIMIMLQLDLVSLWPAYGGLLASSICMSLHSPAFKASVTDLIDQKDYARAGGLIQLAEASRFLISPILAAVLLSRFSLTVVLAVDVITFAAAVVTVALIRGRTSAQPVRSDPIHVFRDLRAALSYITGRPAILQLLLLASSLTCFTGVLQSLFGPMILSFADERTFGMIQSTAALGMILSSLFIGMVQRGADQKTILSAALTAAAVSFTCIGLYEQAAVITIAAFVFFTTLPFVNTALEVLFRLAIDQQMQGRVWSIISCVSQLGLLLALALTGFCADRLSVTCTGPSGPWIAGGANGLLLVLSGGPFILLALLGLPSLRSRHTCPTAA